MSTTSARGVSATSRGQGGLRACLLVHLDGGVLALDTDHLTGQSERSDSALRKHQSSQCGARQDGAAATVRCASFTSSYMAVPNMPFAVITAAGGRHEQIWCYERGVSGHRARRFCPGFRWQPIHRHQPYCRSRYCATQIFLAKIEVTVACTRV